MITKTKTRPLFGFTVLEILIVIAIISILSAISFYSFSDLNKREVLEKETLKVLSLIQDARSLTLSSKNSSQYGVYFNTGSIVSFVGDTFNPSDTANVATNLSSRVSVSSINLEGGGSEVVFQRLSGKTDQSGTINISLVSDINSSTTIRIFETGLSEIE